jgi:peroxiredoxin
VDNKALNDQIDDLNAAAAKGPAAGALATFAKERERHVAVAEEASVRPGDAIPDADLLDTHSAPTTLHSVLAGRPAVLVFYRGAWCPYCNLTLRVYEQQLVPKLTELGVQLIAVSPQKPDNSLSTEEANGLSYAVLSDPGNQLTSSLNILAPEVGQETIEARESIGTDVASHNADGTSRVPMPTTVVVDQSGTIRWIDVRPDWATRSEPEEILDAVAQLDAN